jgi:molybdate transport system substrate-binding protein
MRRPAIALFAVGSAVVLATSACSSSKDSSSPGAGTSSTPAGSSSASAITGDIKVLAAASLTGTFTTIGKQFEAAHPGAHVVFSFEASSAAQDAINAGQKADVFASASPKNMDSVIAKGGAKTSKNFVQNRMEIAIPASNPGKVTQLSDLARSGVKVVLCQAQVPCGATAAKVFANAKLTVKPVSEEKDAKSTLVKVQSEDADAAVVYVTDVLAAPADKVKGVVIPDDLNASTQYPIATLTSSENPTGGQAFVDYVLSAAGQQVMTAGGFLAP